ncbi:hypothetical protein Xmir_03804 [Xenorhabdus miraniensis]|uniref:Uncharacterized protein n=1 Tax=Xenorhabdus miraniensis TaxID=351674 RepID=A0A2D0JKQ3_9GAMM|nr:hypothetical protein Xmir_03804 [Xenorhabdus miraniensis]
MQCRDTRGINQPGQIIHIFMPFGTGHHQTGTREQGPEELPDRHVETERSFLQDTIIRGQAIGILHPDQTITEGTVAVHHSFRLAGGARGIDDIGQMT